MGSGLWTNNLQRAHRVARDLHAGMVWINSYKRVNPGSPFGGVGQSGYGREMGFDAMREYTQVEERVGQRRRADSALVPEAGMTAVAWVEFTPAQGTDEDAMKTFTYQANPSRIVFGAGALAELPREVDLLGATRALVLSTPEQADAARRVAELLGDRAAGIFAKAVMHVPIETAREARAEAARLGADCAVAIGGGSTTGLGKAIALESALPIIAIPTTYAGSEMTPIWGITEAGVKKTGRDARVLPQHRDLRPRADRDPAARR